MQSVQIELPDKIAQELNAMVKAGCFSSVAEVVRLVLLEFTRHNNLELHEQFQREDIVWALKQKEVEAASKLIWFFYDFLLFVE